MDMFYALAEPKRRNILEMLAKQGELSATTIANKFHVSTAAISQHLKVLREAKLVRVEKRAQQRIYTICPEALAELEQWVENLSSEWDKRLDNLERVLAKETKQTKGTHHGKRT